MRATLKFTMLVIITALHLSLPNVMSGTAQDEARDDTAVSAPFDIAPGPPKTAPIDDMRLDRLMDAYQSDDSLQKERPVAAPIEYEVREQRQSEPSGVAKAIASFFSAIGPLVGYLAIFAIAVAILAALYFMFGESLSLRRKQNPKDSGPDVSDIPDLRPDTAQANALLGDADSLAAEGRYAEAVHMLLFRSIEHIQEKQATRVPQSLTAREIGQLESLSQGVRAALWPIIQIVERSYFGGRDVGEPEWLDARASYEVFAFGEATR